jgi:hypothetical protein
MSQDNVDLVTSIQPFDVDIVPLVRDSTLFESLRETLAEVFAPDFECAMPMPGSAEPARYRGLDGLRRAWLDWLEPWTAYTPSLERAVDLGERVLLLVRDRGRHGTDTEVELLGGAIWTVRNGLIAEAFFYPTMEQVQSRSRPSRRQVQSTTTTRSTPSR